MKEMKIKLYSVEDVKDFVRKILSVIEKILYNTGEDCREDKRLKEDSKGENP